MREHIKDARRIQLIEATIASIARRGFAETTLADVADAAKLSRGIVNFYFRSKDELLVETLRHLAAEYEAFWTGALEQAGPDPAAKLLAMIEADFDPVITSRKNVTVWYAFWGESRWRPEFLRICSRLSQSYYEHTREMCRQLAVAGGYDQTDPGAVARGLNAMIDGLWLDLLINPSALDRAEAKRVCRVYLAAAFPGAFPAERDIPRAGAADAA
jgi:TetR/AcrR family transcriptional repressor of bet genes